MNEIITELETIHTIHDLLLWKNKHLGPDSELIKKMNNIKHMTLDDKRIHGKLLNDQFKILNEKFQEYKNIINNKKQSYDSDLPVYTNKSFRNIISQTIEDIKLILIYRGFNFVDCPEIETPFRCFRALNVPDHHPCQNNHQSFHLNNNRILRSHTSTMDTYILERNQCPAKCFTIGRTFRCDNDRTHTPMFHQIDMVHIGPEANVKSLIGTIKTLLFDIFNEEKNIRIRPSFFPFTEPSYEIDMWHNNEWLEILGCGMLHPNVFKLSNSSITSKAWALGMGLERIIMIKYGINDIRKLYE